MEGLVRYLTFSTISYLVSTIYQYYFLSTYVTVTLFTKNVVHQKVSDNYANKELSLAHSVLPLAWYVISIWCFQYVTWVMSRAF